MLFICVGDKLQMHTRNNDLISLYVNFIKKSILLIKILKYIEGYACFLIVLNLSNNILVLFLNTCYIFLF